MHINRNMLRKMLDSNVAFMYTAVCQVMSLVRKAKSDRPEGDK